jgi:Domain of unknown function (DUF4381)
VNPVDPLAQLHPLRDPAAIGWWPLAPGWWLLVCIAAAALLALAWWALRRYRANAYRRQGLRQLEEIRQQLAQADDQSAFAMQINALLKSVALRTYPATEVAALSGEPWRHFLNSCLPQDHQFPRLFSTVIYSPDQSQLDFEALTETAKRWIKCHGRQL